jgi:leucyl aminopeptidase
MKIQTFLNTDEIAKKIRKKVNCEIFLLTKSFKRAMLKKTFDEDDDIHELLKNMNFSGEYKEIRIFYSNSKLVALGGLGETKKLTSQKVRTVQKEVIQDIDNLICSSVIIHPASAKAIHIQAQIESLYEMNYEYKKKGDLFRNVFIPVSPFVQKRIQKMIKPAQSIMEEIKKCRDLINQPGNELNPASFESYIKKNSYSDVKCTVYDAAALNKIGLKLLTSVSLGSKYPARLVQLEYNPTKKKEVDCCLIGKGVTFDSGGMDLKTSSSHKFMKSDMAGAATSLAVIQTLSKIGGKKHVIVLLPLVENILGKEGTRPGDVLEAHNGLKVEIANTDAEGRLCLADCLSYAEKFDAKSIIDIATLTGAADVITGMKAGVIYSNDASMSNALLNAAELTDDRLIQIPLWIEDFEEYLDSKVADCKNVADENPAGTTIAAVFLSKFTKNKCWAHIDFASNAYDEDAGATGACVRLLVEHLK